ncbi:MAG: HFX_2341 family transcriptional regulator domain-containing protein [Promethearchaeota archaeon]
MAKSWEDLITKTVIIMYLGPEIDRLVVPIVRFKAERVYVFVFANKKKDKYYQKYRDNVYPKIIDALPNVEIIEKEENLLDYYHLINVISEIVKKEREEDPHCKILINTATGPVITVLVNVDASRLWDLGLFYVYSHDFEAGRYPEHKGEMIIIFPPTFPIIKPKWEYIEILRMMLNYFIEKDNKGEKDVSTDDYIYKTKLMQKAFSNKIVDYVPKQESDSNDKRKKNAGEHMAFKQKIMTPMIKENLIRTEKESRNVKIFFTERGLKIARIFKSYNPRR